ncbi:hypothetical protein Tco_1047074 [Tanacetum coccineum]
MLVKQLSARGCPDVLVEREATRSRNGEHNDDSRTGVMRQAPLARECTYPDFMKYQPLYFKGTEGVVELYMWFEKNGNLCSSTDVVSYNQRFQELALMCVPLLLEKVDLVCSKVSSYSKLLTSSDTTC